jgi:alpha-N-acetylglucosamine transferase
MSYTGKHNSGRICGNICSVFGGIAGGAAVAGGGNEGTIEISCEETKFVKNAPTKNAYVMLMFGGDSYTEGVMTVAYSLINTKTVCDIVCMVTPDVSEKARTRMKLLGIKVIDVPYLKFETKSMRSKRQRELYTWNNVSYTKWNCMGLTQYEKILFLDADMLVVKNIDHVFDKATPASQFANKKTKHSKHVFGKTISPKQMRKALNKKMFVMDGGLLLIKPNAQQFKDYKVMVKNMEPFGFESVGAADEQSMCYYMGVYDKGPRCTWYNLGSKYSCSWTVDCKPADSYILNFIGEIKPWNKDTRKEFPDTLPWYEVNEKMNKFLDII